MTTLAAGLMLTIGLVLVFPLTWLIGDHRSGRYPLGPAARSVGTVLAAGAVVGGAAALGGLIGVALLLTAVNLLG